SGTSSLAPLSPCRKERTSVDVERGREPRRAKSSCEPKPRCEGRCARCSPSRRARRPPRVTHPRHPAPLGVLLPPSPDGASSCGVSSADAEAPWQEGGRVARKGDLIVLNPPRVGGPAREGEIIEVMEGDLRVQYRVRW